MRGTHDLVVPDGVRRTGRSSVATSPVDGLGLICMLNMKEQCANTQPKSGGACIRDAWPRNAHTDDLICSCTSLAEQQEHHGQQHYWGRKCARACRLHCDCDSQLGPAPKRCMALPCTSVQGQFKRSGCYCTFTLHT